MVGIIRVPSLPINVQRVRKPLCGNAVLLRYFIRRTELAIGCSKATHEGAFSWIVSFRVLASFDKQKGAFFP
jgi:hypothetical protein